ncbi:hypothetical protein ACXET9_02340 [Brachybacterium sp. DNPG3]
MTADDAMASADVTTADDAPTAGRSLPLITGAAALLLGLIAAADLLQMLLGLPFTANDLLFSVWPRPEWPEFVFGVALNAVQTLFWAVISGVVLVGGALCIARRRGLSAAAGVLAILAVALPTVLHLGLLTLLQWNRVIYSDLSLTIARLSPSATILAGMVPALIAGTMLLLSVRRRIPAVGPRPFAALGLLGAAILLIANLHSLIQVVASRFSWWAVQWSGVQLLGPLAVGAVVTALLITVLAGAIGAAFLLGSRSRIARAGGTLVLASVVVRLLSQTILLGMNSWLTRRIWYAIDFSVLYTGEWAVTILVLALSVVGIVLAIAGLLRAAVSGSEGATGSHAPPQSGPSTSPELPRR